MTQHYYKLDLHTHSIHSKDGGITEGDYKLILDCGKLDYIAITDHDDVSFALSLQKKLGDRIIVGEEIRTAEGEVIGLFLQKKIPPQLSLGETIARIKEQQGLVYLPHPFCHNRFGVSETAIAGFEKNIDIVEHFNPRNIVHTDNVHAEQFALTHTFSVAASSDAHCVGEFGKTYSYISAVPTKKNLVTLLQQAEYLTSYTSFFHLFCPKKNTLKKKIGLR